MHLRRSALFLALFFFASSASADEPQIGECTFRAAPDGLANIIKACSKLLADPALTNDKIVAALYSRGRASHNLMQLDPALDDYTEALKRAPFDVEILMSRANIYSRTSKIKLRLLDLLKALNIDPDNADVLISVGNAYSEGGLSGKAIEHYSRAIELNPKKTFAYVFRSNEYSKNNDLIRALPDADAAVESARNPDQPNYFEEGIARDLAVATLIERALLLRRMGEIDRADRDYDAAVAIDRSAFALMKRAKYSTRGIAAAIADLQEAIRREPRYGTALYLLGLKLMDTDQDEAAFIVFNEAVAVAPNNGYSLRMRAFLHRKLGHPEEAFNDLMQAIRVDGRILPETIPTLRTAGYWNSLAVPQTMTPALQDALRACMIDTRC